jgi:AraC-like DNA-binding protein
VDYRAYPPSPALRPWVRHFWILEGVGGNAPESIFPDGSMEIAVHLGEPFADSSGPQHHSLFIGQMDAPLTVFSAERTLCVGIKFEPWGAASFVPIPLDESGGRIRSLDEAWSHDAHFLRERLGNAVSDTQRITILEDMLERRRRAFARAPDSRLADAVQLLVNGNARVETVAQHAGMSTRQFERRVRAIAGASPKLLARVFRFQRALARAGRADWAAIAADCGYFDQAHLIRDFRQFTGAPPTRCEPGSVLGAVSDA